MALRGARGSMGRGATGRGCSSFLGRSGWSGIMSHVGNPGYLRDVGHSLLGGPGMPERGLSAPAESDPAAWWRSVCVARRRRRRPGRPTVWPRVIWDQAIDRIALPGGNEGDLVGSDRPTALAAPQRGFPGAPSSRGRCRSHRRVTRCVGRRIARRRVRVAFG